MIETIDVKGLNLSEAEEIQFMYPEEPDWPSVSDEILVALVKDYVSEPNCAMIALGELDIRGHPLAKPIAAWLLEEEHADEWLKRLVQDKLYDE
ncbi:hypothetical protein [Microbulbifer sp.]|uniref:hypothetical protein n=1 Tax=Microbulbifer sp. TaxID=1908541 RepID=UPI003F67009B